MEKSTKIKILVLIVVYILLWNIEARAGSLLELRFDTIVHDRPVTIWLKQITSSYIPDDINANCLDSGEFCYTTTWEIEIVENDDMPVTPTVMPTVSPTVNPTITVSPTVSPTVGPTVNPPTSGYVASQSSTKFHLPDCYHVSRILPANLVHFATREEALASGRTPCGTCQP